MKLDYKAKKHEGINPGGDCGPACLSGVTGISIKDLYENYFKRIDGTCYTDMLAACWKLYWEGKIKWLDNKLCQDQGVRDPEYATFGSPSWENFNSWLKHVITQTKQGYVGIAQVQLHGKAYGDLKHQFYTDHWVLIVGGEDLLTEEGDKRLVYISCPTKGEFAVHPLEFLMCFGGYNPIWILPNKQ